MVKTTRKTTPIGTIGTKGGVQKPMNAQEIRITKNIKTNMGKVLTNLSDKRIYELAQSKEDACDYIKAKQQKECEQTQKDLIGQVGKKVADEFVRLLNDNIPGLWVCNRNLYWKIKTLTNSARYDRAYSAEFLKKNTIVYYTIKNGNNVFDECNGKSVNVVTKDLKLRDKEYTVYITKVDIPINEPIVLY